LYRTKWEIDQKALVFMAADRAPFIDHSQALSLYMAKANEEIISDMHMLTWKLVRLFNFKNKLNIFIFI
jgi:ribonucleotide reductase alpha subunit